MKKIFEHGLDGLNGFTEFTLACRPTSRGPGPSVDFVDLCHDSG